MALPLRRPHKYHAQPVVVDGVRFASTAEARRYQELKLLEKAGEIWDLELQPKFPLCVPSTSGYLTRAAVAILNGGTFKIGEYRADFKYYDRRTTPFVVEDVKGFKTPLYRWKKKHVEAQYGIQVREIHAHTRQNRSKSRRPQQIRSEQRAQADSGRGGG